MSQYKHLTEINLSANAYVTKRGTNDGITIGVDGLHNWTSNEAIISTYFYAKNAFKFDLFIKCKVLPNGESELQMTLDRTLFSVSGSAKVSGTQYQSFKVGSYEILSKGYHKIDLRGVSKTGQYFADVSQLLIGQNTTEDNVVAVAKNQDRGTPSIHLWYVVPKDNIEYYYNEVTVVNGFDPIGSYYMAIGFEYGYLGIQVNSETERRILFSVWSPQDTQNPGNVTEENKVKLVKKGDKVETGDFGGEGSGGHAILKYMWKTGSIIKFLVRGVPDQNDKTHTIYTAWYALESGVWQLMASFSRPKSGHYLKGFYSFMEDFNPNTGYQTRKAQYGNQWVCDISGQWNEVIQATFTGNDSANKRVKFDFDAGVDIDRNKECFFLMNGGFFEGKTALNSKLTRNANKIKPDINLNKLP